MAKLYTFDQQAAEDTLYEVVRLRSKVRNLEQNLNHVKHILGWGGGSSVNYGTPQSVHNTGTAVSYSLTDRTGFATGASVEDVWNDTGQTLQPSVSHIIVSVNGGKLAFPFQLADCSSWSNVT